MESFAFILAGGLGIGNSVLCGTGVEENRMEGYTMLRRFFVFSNLELSTKIIVVYVVSGLSPDSKNSKRHRMSLSPKPAIQV